MSDYVSRIYFTCSFKHRPKSKQVLFLGLLPVCPIYVMFLYYVISQHIVIEWNYRIQKQNQNKIKHLKRSTVLQVVHFIQLSVVK
jgi:hypothetical protein